MSGKDARFRQNSGKHLVALSFSGFDPIHGLP
jgi:hypothetical protein